MPSRIDWTAPHWETVAAEQILLAPSLVKHSGAIRVARSPHGGRKRIKHPETGAPIKTTGDVGAFGPFRVLALWFGDAWHPVPSHADAMRWTLDGMAETPDGRTVEPDDLDSWLVLCDLI
tara:strand:- start:16 stop:375 length:360 start_codon:yes stop_codon:yes gene_type:complete